jgi:hypothetical protein
MIVSEIIIKNKYLEKNDLKVKSKGYHLLDSEGKINIFIL